MNWDYIAGFFDGEGNINIIKNNQKLSYYIQIRLYSSDERVLLEIKKFIQRGQIYKVKKSSATNFVYELTLSNKIDVKFFLENIVDKIVIKREIAEYVLAKFSFGRDNNREFDISIFRNLNQKNKGNIITPLTE
jgi:hypothetical protein